MTEPAILLDHGSGGERSGALIEQSILPHIINPHLAVLNDGASVSIGEHRIAFSTDSYVVDPIFFPGGSIGHLAVHGTVNDVAMCGARPLYLSCALIMEEGFPLADLERIMADMGASAKKAGVAIITGDTKVVPKGACDKIFINTTGIGIIPEGTAPSADRAMPGDAIILSGTIGDHGLAILSSREGLTFQSDIKSDTAPLNQMVAEMIAICPDIHVLRDPTRGGVATVLNEVASASGVHIAIHEDKLPIRPDVAALGELLGLDPLYTANEGKLLAWVPRERADSVLAAIKKSPHGKEAAIIGEVTAMAVQPHVTLTTVTGGQRRVPRLTGEQLPRIC
jgi:hydrogenase expression/formation protein HypE